MPPTPKILYTITKGSWGGAQRYVFDLARTMSKMGAEVTVAYGDSGSLCARLTEIGIRTVPLAGLTRDISPYKELRAFFALVALLRKERPDILHTNSSKAGLLGAIAGRMTGVPRIVFTAHGWSFNEDRPRWQKRILHVFHVLTVILSHETICVSEAVKKDIVSPWTVKKLTVVRNGIAWDTLLPRTVAREHTLPDVRTPVWIGMVAELHKTKRVDLAIHSFARIAHTHPETALVVYGEGEERLRLESLIRTYHLEGRIFLPGFITHAATHLAAFDVLLVPSRSEALAYVVLEAGNARLPVIASRVGGLPEVIEDGVSGMLVPPSDVDALADAIREVLEDPRKAETLGEHLHARIVRDFSEERMVKETWEVYFPATP